MLLHTRMQYRWEYLSSIRCLTSLPYLSCRCLNQNVLSVEALLERTRLAQPVDQTMRRRSATAACLRDPLRSERLATARRLELQQRRVERRGSAFEHKCVI